MITFRLLRVNDVISSLMGESPGIRQFKHIMPNDNLYMEPAPYLTNPVSLLNVSRGCCPVLLHSGGPVGEYCRWSIFSCRPHARFTARNGVTSIDVGGKVISSTSNPFSVLRDFLLKSGFNCCPPETVAELPFTGGAIGYIGYEAGNYLEDLPPKKPGGMGLPDICFHFYGAAYLMDHHTGRAWITGIGPQASGEVDMLRRVVTEAAEADYSAAPAVPGTVEEASRKFDCSYGYEEYIRSIERTFEYIAAGDIFQANIAQQFESGFSGNSVELFDLLNRINPAPHSAYLEADDHQILSCSPELFLKNAGQVVQTRPIKGTRPRTAAAGEDMVLRNELMQSLKDSAEHVMIVDLERNDLGRVCEYGSVHVPEMKIAESFPRVHHLVSTISGRLRQGIGAVELLRATFPGGSITGAPKIRSMEIINELENVPREVYTGSIGFIDVSGNFQFNIAIRTIVIREGRIYFSVGGGIVADSVPESEYAETITKASNLMLAIEAMNRKRRFPKHELAKSKRKVVAGYRS